MPDELIHCLNPLCGDQGWYPDYDRNGEVVQVQCEFCWTNPLSYFNATQQSVQADGACTCANRHIGEDHICTNCGGVA